MVLSLGCFGTLIGALKLYFSAEVGAWGHNFTLPQNNQARYLKYLFSPSLEFLVAEVRAKARTFASLLSSLPTPMLLDRGSQTENHRTRLCFPKTPANIDLWRSEICGQSSITRQKQT